MNLACIGDFCGSHESYFEITIFIGNDDSLHTLDRGKQNTPVFIYGAKKWPCSMHIFIATCYPKDDKRCFSRTARRDIEQLPGYSPGSPNPLGCSSKSSKLLGYVSKSLDPPGSWNLRTFQVTFRIL